MRRSPGGSGAGGGDLTAAAAALVLALHPAHSTSVLYIQGRPGLLSTAFCLAAMIAAVEAIQRWERARHRAPRTIAVVALVALAALSKETGAVVPALVLLYDAILAARQEQQTAAFQQAYTLRAGIEGTVLGRRLRIGKVEYALELSGEAGQGAWARRWPALAAQLPRDDSVIALADEQGALALFSFGEVLRPDAAALVDAARALGAEVVLVSGDRAGSVDRVARALGIERAYAQQTPASKRELVAQLQGTGRRVAMLGDGFNDAPVLAQADVSIALAEGAALAQARADFIVLGSRAADVANLLRSARRCMRIVRENFVWALVYNLAAIPLAAFGYLSPALAAVGMAASSGLVVANALRARR